jgi:uncharacterized protein (DUF1330 family)
MNFAFISGESTMPGYWIARAHIHNPTDYKKYTDKVPEIFAKYDAKVLARGGKFQIMEGPEEFHRFVVVEFPTFEAAVECFESAEYKAAATFRRNGAGNVEITIVESGDATVR